MAAEEEWKRVRELRVESAKAHQAYAALVEPPKPLNVMPETPEEKEAREQCGKVDEQLSAAILAATKADR